MPRMSEGTVPPRLRRAALEVLTRDRLASITEKYNLTVEDRRAQAAHIDAIVRSRSLDFGDVLRLLQRDELKAMCEALGLDTSGKEKDPLIERILAGGNGIGTGGTVANQKNGEKTGTNFALSVPEAKPKKARAPAAPRSAGGEPTADYRHDAKRKNNPPAGLVDLDKAPPQPTRKYEYDPHLDPQLQWTGKKEHTSFEVDTVSLHIHERVSAQAIMRAVKREDAQRDLFAEDNLPESKAIDFYAHEVGWSNRVVLGDSLLVMNSLLEREQMAGKVQCIYVDPPYGVRFNSNFQPLISKRDVKDGDDASLTREPEQIQAYRDTWTLGIHSYLTYLRDRLLLARELLAETGSIFVQISDENVHHVRELMDEVFGGENFSSIVPVVKTAGLGSTGLTTVCDYLLWYAKNREHMKFRPLYIPRSVGEDEQYVWLELPDGTRRRMTPEERQRPSDIPAGARVWRPAPLTSGAFRENTTVPYKYGDKVFHPGPTSCWKTTVQGLDRLAAARRLFPIGNTLCYVRYLDDFPVVPLRALWTDTGSSGFGDPRVYVVQTNSKVIARCILLTTDPGDLVLDPTCGSGTTAFVAEQWGRRWVTCDTSRVALAVARQRILTARFPYYRLRSDKVRDGFVYETVPHITLGSIATNEKLDACKTHEDQKRLIRQSAEQEVLYDQPEEDKGKVRVAGPFTVEAIPVASMEDASESPIPQLEPDAREDDLARPGRGVAEFSAEYGSGTDYTRYMVDLLKKSGGVHFKNGKNLSRGAVTDPPGAPKLIHPGAGKVIHP
jgi:adenine-specific DNA-methyltransferase